MKSANPIGTFVCAAFGVACPAVAQLETGFEPPTYAGTAPGTGLAGQNGWSIVPSGGTPHIDWSVYPYTGNAPGIGGLPVGETQFVAGEKTAAGLARVAHAAPVSAGTWTLSFDLAIHWLGAPASPTVMGSVSLQPTQNFYIAFFAPAPGVPTPWDIHYPTMSAGGPLCCGSGTLPGPAWSGLAYNHWYHLVTVVDFVEHRITEVSITDLATGAASTVKPSGWYLSGGPASTEPLPDAIMLSAVGVHNPLSTRVIVAVDNLSLTAGAPCYPDCNADGALTVADFGCFQTKFVLGDPYADCNASGTLTVADFGCFQSAFVGGCP